jgi:hypothetical protein
MVFLERRWRSIDFDLQHPDVPYPLMYSQPKKTQGSVLSTSHHDSWMAYIMSLSQAASGIGADLEHQRQATFPERCAAALHTQMSFPSSNSSCLPVLVPRVPSSCARGIRAFFPAVLSAFPSCFFCLASSASSAVICPLVRCGAASQGDDQCLSYLDWHGRVRVMGRFCVFRVKRVQQGQTKPNQLACKPSTSFSCSALCRPCSSTRLCDVAVSAVLSVAAALLD